MTALLSRHGTGNAIAVNGGYSRRPEKSAYGHGQGQPDAGTLRLAMYTSPERTKATLTAQCCG